VSNARANMLGTVTHSIERKLRATGEGFLGHCGAVARHASTDRAAVTCKRCLASLAKRDRAFQRKARGYIGGFASGVRGRADDQHALWHHRDTIGTRAHALHVVQQANAACAIAREEGRGIS
jgi:hypothetical protein